MIVGDLSKESANEKVINEIINHFKRLDVLVSCILLFFFYFINFESFVMF